jgi:nicotinamide riboside kinase
MRIAIVGVESTGKTWLANQLSHTLKIKKMDEVAREYLTLRNGEYHREDLDKISTLTYENLMAIQKDDVILDTEWLVLKIWSEEKYNTCSLEILNHYYKVPIDIYLLMDIDLDYEAEPLREHPLLEDRKRIHEIYKAHLSLEYIPFGMVRGTGEDRLKCALEIIHGYMHS